MKEFNKICKFCARKMRLDDVDNINFYTKELYYICDHCYHSCDITIRKERIVDIKWNKSDLLDMPEIVWKTLS